MLSGLLISWIALAAAQAPAPGASSDADREFDEIVGTVTEDSRDASCARMQAWVDAHPNHPQIPRGLVWMSKLRHADGRDDLARSLLERTLREYRGTEWELHAIQGLADLDLKSHRYGRAIAGYETLARSPDPLFSYIGRYGALNARGERVRFDVFLGLLAALAALSLHRLWRSGWLRSLWPPPAELLYPLPVPLLMLVGSTALEVPERHTVITLALGGIALLWLNGAYLRARPPKGGGRVVQAALGIFQACALLYCAMIANGLWGKLVDTIAMGAE